MMNLIPQEEARLVLRRVLSMLRLRRVRPVALQLPLPLGACHAVGMRRGQGGGRR